MSLKFTEVKLMQNQDLNGNVVHNQNLAVLTAAATLGTEVMLRVIGSKDAAATLEGENLTTEVIRDALVARLVKFLG